MKKIIVCASLTVSFFYGSMVFAEKPFCVTVYNLSPQTIELAGTSDPGFEPKVEPHSHHTLGGDYFTNCSGNCNVQIYEKNKETFVNVPNGSAIFYEGPSKFHVEEKGGDCSK